MVFTRKHWSWNHKNQQEVVYIKAGQRKKISRHRKLIGYFRRSFLDFWTTFHSLGFSEIKGNTEMQRTFNLEFQVFLFFNLKSSYKENMCIVCTFYLWLFEVFFFLSLYFPFRKRMDLLKVVLSSVWVGRHSYCWHKNFALDGHIKLLFHAHGMTNINFLRLFAVKHIYQINHRIASGWSCREGRKYRTTGESEPDVNHTHKLPTVYWFSTYLSDAD